jgi:hypothetical protein
MTDIKGFPPVPNGNCDGLGCGDHICWCDEHAAMAEEYQRQYNKQWDYNSSECNTFENGWRVGNKFIKLANELQRKLESHELRVLKWNSDRYLWLRKHAISVEPTQVVMLPLVLPRGKYSLLHRNPDQIIDIAVYDEVAKEEKAVRKANQTPN